MNPELVVLAERVGVWLQSRSWTLATAESCTGGLVAAAITEIPGSSTWFDRGFVTYSNAAKKQMLGVSADTLSMHGAVSEQTVHDMLTGAIAHSDACVAIAISGIAGPGGGTPDKPVGTVCLGLRTPDEVQIMTMLFQGDRAAIRTQAACHVLKLLLRQK